jgi:hypothetical protein
MDMRKGPMKYAEGDMVESEEDAAERRKRAIVAGIPDQAMSDSISEFDEKDPPKKKPKKKPVKKNMGGMMKYKKGGKVKVRGAGKAIKGVRPAKMVKM